MLYHVVSYYVMTRSKSDRESEFCVHLFVCICMCVCVYVCVCLFVCCLCVYHGNDTGQREVNKEERDRGLKIG